MSVVETYRGESATGLTRFRRTGERLLRNRRLIVTVGIAGMLGSFGAILVTGDPGRVGAAAFSAWVVLLAVELGPGGGLLAGVAATLLYVIVAVDIGGPSDDAVALAVRAAVLSGIGFAFGLGARRITSDARELQATSALRQALLDSTVDAICLTDVTGTVVLANAPLLRLAAELGLSGRGPVTEQLLVLADRTRDPARFRERMTELERDLAPSEDEFELAESGRVFRGYTAPVNRPDGSFVGRIWTLREVTADRRLERLRDAFVAAVSHELRTPLTSISGFLEMLADEEHLLEPSGREYLLVIRRGTRRLQRIVEDLLLIAQIEAERLQLHPAPGDLAEIARAAVTAAQPAALEKGVALEIRADGASPVEADAGRVGQVLDNLVSNAIKFTAAGGSVTVTVAGDDGAARIEVADSGIGIPQDEIGQLFSRFYRASTATRRAIPGTGLGLVIAQAIVEGHGGSISLTSREGEGTRVVVTLPARAAAASRSESAAPSARTA